MLDKPDPNYKWLSYAELANQYEHSIQLLRAQIKRLQQEEENGVNYSRGVQLRRQIAALYEIHCDAVRSLRALRKYAAREVKH